MTIEWLTYVDKVYGMLAGSVSGYDLAGMNNSFAKVSLKTLEVIMPAVRTVENYGVNFLPENAAECYAEDSTVYSEEYPYFKENYRCGLLPPYTGEYNNPFSMNFTGALRAGFWGSLAPANPELAVKTCSRCAGIELGGEAFEAEKYFTAMASLMFSSKSSKRKMTELVERSSDFLTEGSAAAEIVGSVLEMFKKGKDAAYIVRNLSREYGSANRKDYKMNLALITAAILTGNGSMEDTFALIKKTDVGHEEYCLNMAGQILGINEGGNSVEKKHPVAKLAYETKTTVSGSEKRINEISMDIARLSLMLALVNKKCKYNNAPVPEAPKKGVVGKFYTKFDYSDGSPETEPGMTKKIRLNFIRTNKFSESGEVEFTPTEGITVKSAKKKYRIGFFKKASEVTVMMSKDAPIVNAKNVITATIKPKKGDVVTERIGLPGKHVYNAYGPFTEKYEESRDYESYSSEWMPKEKEYSSYYNSFYNAKADKDRKYLEDSLVMTGSVPQTLVTDPLYRKKKVYVSGDVISVEDFFGAEGPCVIYLERDVFSEKEQYVRIEIGYSDAFRLWKDGELTAYADDVNSYSPKNIVRADIRLMKGKNRFVIKLVRRNGKSDFSMKIFEDLSGGMTSCIAEGTGDFND